MIGTIVNTCCIVTGSIVGSLLKKGLDEKYTKALFNAMGLVSLALGASTFASNMPKSEMPVLFILSLAIGGVVGTALDLVTSTVLQRRSRPVVSDHLSANGIRNESPAINSRLRAMSKHKEQRQTGGHCDRCLCM